VRAVRFKVLYEIDRIPIYYRNIFMSLIKESLKTSETGKIYIDKLFEYRENDIQKVNKTPRPFCFAVRFQFDKDKFKEDKENFYLKSPLEFYLSSFDPAFLIILYNGLINDKLYPFIYGDKICINRGRTIFLREKEINEDTARFKTLSPILIEDKEEQPIIPDLEGNNEAFARELNYISDSILRGVRGGIGLKKELRFTPLKIRKEVVKHKIKERNEFEKIYTFTCFNGTFQISGAPEDIEALHKLGIGLRRAQGFGMVEVV
jgi:CRISPR-associated endoribonuclease Cas6